MALDMINQNARSKLRAAAAAVGEKKQIEIPIQSGPKVNALDILGKKNSTSGRTSAPVSNGRSQTAVTPGGITIDPLDILKPGSTVRPESLVEGDMTEQGMRLQLEAARRQKEALKPRQNYFDVDPESFSGTEQGSESQVFDVDPVSFDPARGEKDYAAAVQKHGELANRYYYLKNEQQQAAVRADKAAAQTYAAAVNGQDELRKIEYVMEAIGSNRVTEQVSALREELMDRYGLKPSDFEGERIWEVYRGLAEAQQERKAALSAAGYDFGQLYDYDRRIQSEKAARELSEQNKELAARQPVLSSAASVAAMPATGLEYYAQALGNLGHNDPDDPDSYIPLSTAQMPLTTAVGDVRGTVAGQIAGKEATPLQRAAAFLYQTGMSMADSVTQVATLGPAAIAVMGSASAANTTKEIIDRGGTNKQALTGGLAAGVAEAFFEKFSVENLRQLAMNKSGTRKAFFENMAKQSLIEASEETFTEIANILSDAMIMGENSNTEAAIRAYRKNMPEREAILHAYLDNVVQVAVAGLGGALSGAGSTAVYVGPGYAGNSLKQYAYDAANGRDLVYHSVNFDLLDAAMKLGEETEAHRTARKISAALDQDPSGNRVSDAQWGRLRRQVQAALAAQEQGQGEAQAGGQENTASTGEAAETGIVPFSDIEADRLTSKKGIVNGNGITFRQFVDNAKRLGNTVRFYFGKVSQSLGEKIADAVGKNVEGYNIAIRSDEVLHAMARHGDAQAEAKRGQLPITPEALERLPEVFNAPDEVVGLTQKDYAGRTAFEVRKQIDGYMVAVVGISDGKHSIEIDSVYIINKGRTPTTVDATHNASLDPTSETSSGQAFLKNTIPQSGEDVKAGAHTTAKEQLEQAAAREQQRAQAMADVERALAMAADEAEQHRAAQGANGQDPGQNGTEAAGSVQLDDGSTITKGEFLAGYLETHPGATEADARRVLEEARQLNFFGMQYPSIGVKGAQSAGATDAGQRYSIDRNFAKEIKNWDGHSDTYFHIGTTSDALRGIGIADKDIVLRSSKVVEILNKHDGMTCDIIQQLPELLEHPVMVLNSRSASPDNRNQSSRVVVFGEVYDRNGAPVTAILELRPTLNGGEVQDYNLLVSSYGKNKSLHKMVEESEVLYLDPDKKRTDTWLHGLRLQLPSYETKYGSIGSISYEDGFVNIEGTPWHELTGQSAGATGEADLHRGGKRATLYSVDKRQAAFQRNFSGEVTGAAGVDLSSSEKAAISHVLKTGYGKLLPDGSGGSVNTAQYCYVFKVTQNGGVAVTDVVDHKILNIHDEEIGGETNAGRSEDNQKFSTAPESGGHRPGRHIDDLTSIAGVHQSGADDRLAGREQGDYAGGDLSEGLGAVKGEGIDRPGADIKKPEDALDDSSYRGGKRATLYSVDKRQAAFQRNFSGEVTGAAGVDLSSSEKAAISHALKTGYGKIETDGSGGSVNTAQYCYVFEVTQNGGVEVTDVVDHEDLNIHHNNFSEVYEYGDQLSNNQETGTESEGRRSGHGDRRYDLSSAEETGQSGADDRLAGREQGDYAGGDLSEVQGAVKGEGVDGQEIPGAKPSVAQQRTIDYINAVLPDGAPKVELRFLTTGDNGFYVEETNSIVLNGSRLREGYRLENGARLTAQQALVYTLGHELVHDADSRTAGQMTEALRRFGEREYGAETWEAWIRETQKTYLEFYTDTLHWEPAKAERETRRGKMEQEVCADLMRDIFLGGAVLERFAQSERGALERAIAAAGRLRDRLAGRIAGVGDALVQAPVVRAEAEELIRRLELALGKNEGRGTVRKTDENRGVRYSVEEREKVEVGQGDRGVSEEVSGAGAGVRGSIGESRESGQHSAGEFQPALSDVPVLNWAREATVVPAKGSPSELACDHVKTYGVSAFALKAGSMLEHGIAVAFTNSGQVFIDEGLSQELQEAAAVHEVIHAMYQREFRAYRQFVMATEQYMVPGELFERMKEHVANHQRLNVGVADLSLEEQLHYWDEFNATVYGSYIKDPAAFRERFAAAFKNLDGYISEVESLLEQFKGRESSEERRYSVTTERPAGSGETDVEGAEYAGAYTEEERAEARRLWQELGTESPYFKRFYDGNTRELYDEDGKPKTVYHGTAKEIRSFDKSRRGKFTRAEDAGLGFFFTDSSRVAGGYARYTLPTEILELRDRFDAAERELGTTPEAEALFRSVREEYEQAVRNYRAEGSNGTVMKVFLSMKEPLVKDFRGAAYQGNADEYVGIIRQAMAEGRDGVIIKNVYDTFGGKQYREISNIYVVFEPGQIKSADNQGTFDSGDPNVRYSVPTREQRSAAAGDEGIQKQEMTLQQPAGYVKEDMPKRRFSVDGRAFSEDRYFSRQMDKWTELKDGNRVKVGTVRNGSALQQVGLPASGMYFDVGKVKKAMAEHGDHLTAAVLKSIPDLLNDPVVISEYKGPKGDIKNTVNVYGDLFVGGTPVVVGVVMNLDSAGQNIINNIRTVHARSDFAKQITDDSVLYLNENKKRTRKWFQDCGNSNVPLAGTQFGFIHSITFENGGVKRFSLDGKTADSGAVQYAWESDPYAGRSLTADSGVHDGIPGEYETKEGGLRYSLQRSFEDQVDAALHGELERNTAVYVMDTPEMLQALGLKDYPMLMTQRHIRDVNHEKAENNQHYHGIPEATIKQLPEMIREPVIVMESASHPGELVVVTSELDPDGLPIVVAIKPDGTGHFNRTEIASNFVKTMYGKNGFGRFIQSAADSDRVLYNNKRRTQSLFSRVRLQLPESLRTDGFFKNSIQPKGNDVKPGAVQYSVDGEVNPETGYRQGSFEDSVVRLMRMGSQEEAKSTLEQTLAKLVRLQEEQERQRLDELRRQVLRPKQSEDALERNRRTIERLIEKYGRMEQTGAAQQKVDLPKQVDDKTRVAGAVQTMMAAPGTNEVIRNELTQEILSGTAGVTYARIGDQATLEQVDRELQRNGFDKMLQEWEHTFNGGGEITKLELARAEQLYVEACRNKEVGTALKLAAEIAAAGTRAGQTVQAMTLLKRMTPSGQAYYIQKTVDRLNRDTKLKLKAPITLDPKLVKELLDAHTREEMDAAMDALIQNVADQVPVTLADKWNAWRYFAMLGNARTHIRNLAGNAIFVPARLAKDVIGAGLECAARLDRNQRTKSITVSKELKHFAEQDAEVMKDTLAGGGKYNPADQIRDRRTIYTKLKFLNALTKTNSRLLEAEDWVFLRKAYIHALSHFLAARGADISTVSGENSTVEGRRLLNEAREYAVREAQRATYRDMSKIAGRINNLKRNSGKAGAVLLEGLMPFTKTPINIIKRGVEYSPIGLIKGLTYDIAQLKQGHLTAAEVIDHISAGTTGLGITLLGVLLAHLGLLAGAMGDDDEERFDKLQGKQGYSLQVGGVSYTIDWMAPVALPLFVGAEIYHALDSGFEGVEPGKILSAVADGITSILEPMLSLSMLDGLNKTLSANRYGDEEDTIYAILATIAFSYFSQGIPTLFGQVARTLDDSRRSTFTPKDQDKVMSAVSRFWQNSVQGKLPICEEDRMLYVDSWGRTDTTGSVALRAFENMISPGYISKLNTTAVDAELERLSKALGSNDMLPKRAQKFFTADHRTYAMTQEEYEDHLIERGQTSYDLVNDLIHDPGYADLADEERSKAIQFIYSYAAQTASYHTNGKYERDNWIKWLDDFVEQGGDAIDYILLKTAAAMRGGSASVSDMAYSRDDLTTAQMGQLILSDMSKEQRRPGHFTDPYMSGYEYIMSEEQQAKYTATYDRLFMERFEELYGSEDYRRAAAEERKAMVTALRTEVSAAAKREMSDWLYDQGIEPTEK